MFKIKESDIGLGLGVPLFLFVFSLMARLCFFPYWQHLELSGDEIHYWSSARVLASGTLLKNFLHPPLWSYILTIPALISDNYVYGRIFTSIISSFSAPLIYLLGKYVFNRKTGVIAGIVYSIYPNIIGFSHYLWTETLLSLLILLSTALFFKAIDDMKKQIYLYLSFSISSLSLLVKEFAIIHFLSIILTLAYIKINNKRQIIIRAIIIFITPVVMYSAFASILDRRPVMLADAFVYNSNEADYGKDIWKQSTKDNLRIFMGRLIMVKKLPERFGEQMYNLWTPNSFLIFRLLHSGEKYRNVPYADLLSYIAAAMYIFVITLGVTGVYIDRTQAFKIFVIANLLILSSMGLLFLMCSRFRIPFIYLFIVYSSKVLSNPKLALKKITWKKVLFLTPILALFIHIIMSRSASFGYWG